MLLFLQRPQYLLDKSKWNPQQKVLVRQHLKEMITIVKRLSTQNKCMEMFSKGIFGHFLSMKVVKDFPSRIVHQAVMRLTSVTDDELHFLFGKKQVVFGPKEFAIMTGLNCEDLFIRLTKTPSQDQKFKKTYFPDDSKLKVDNIRSVFTSAENIPDEDLVKLANLYFLEDVLLPRESYAQIDMEHVHLLDDLNDFYLHLLCSRKLSNTSRMRSGTIKLVITRYQRDITWEDSHMLLLRSSLRRSHFLRNINLL